MNTSKRETMTTITTKS